MFGSKDKPEHPEQGPESGDNGKGGKKGLFGWMRRKGDEPAAPVAPPQQTPVDTPAAEVEPVIAAAEVEPVTAPTPATEPSAPAAAPAPSHDQAAREAAAELFSGLAEQPADAAPAPQPQEPKGFFARMRAGLSKTSANLGEGMANLFLGEKEIDDELLEEMETRLLMADVGIEATTLIMESLQQRVRRRELSNRNALYKALQNELEGLLAHVAKPMVVDSEKRPYVILVVGVNGVGKTTTIGKLAKRLQGEGKQVMLAAGDTFRAAAVEQLQVWGERNNIPVVAQHTGADSASVVFDALQAAKSRGVDVLIADTAGRLHNKDNLMDELKKVKRVLAKLDAEAPHEVLLVLDAGTGQNAISQTKLFDQAVGLTGLALTKLDGTAKGGVIFALAKQFGLPIRFIGVGEQIDDLRPFTAPEFVKALFGRE
ncbi:signal recognition particle-docking protein FtsY [Pseudomonas sp. G11-1]|uniref:Signal recognition particle receptor FtsY n=1 Tax=Halopseudomonas bauzanensis TaxID=653930 RepID=A0A1I4QKK9_9GAMM|nr:MULTISPECIES: signal recognition particle-docking protein FtsY [Halopseudomonas]MCO5785918.1 signal recognition particle-docking protein FtsY [Pseudomonas sp. G11-1]MCO5787978.1 signal recognition particle-docking protein FtsY [Pseudomonas sp. G11-2]WGK61507.1 signal recognition particle-docking protein FtsY [Halopseudomonas sp. SMJS2]SES37775.1 signal recognition particle-docking protein FtsY [Halopseudomonas bauzanensis]SFM40599.1 fused signal recognition particle receptor [Halopseudomona